MLRSLPFAALFLSLSTAAFAGTGLVEPTLKMTPRHDGRVRVAMTLDACMGKTDHRILDTLVQEKIPATIFVTARWLKHNSEALAVMMAHPDLFEIENHGENHVPAVDKPLAIYGIAAAGSEAAVEQEVEGGRQAIVAMTGLQPQWFRGATAKYTTSSMATINRLGMRVAGYSVNGDGGSLLGAAATAKHIASARDGDVIISHINQPTHEAGEGVVRGLLALKARGVVFTRLDDPSFTPPGN
ncbi:Polysaccharide deacetylase protein [Agrobacterium fabacearum CFBP 5771]|uniref:polysaccharide deacetylase family protein n=1 Tax=Rhizobium/Agrobacterium group TaxID=227290 RepID=UPI00047032F6|nr:MULTISPECIES: polysaccharide deacetylase family protein [Rhizobium/Agrobacterium group]KQY53388.1 polysaccharide deacetylase [Rhizobium sp. Root491]MDR5008138.1 polysaccharide deacetylase family protein [Agrobacterium tumefaciens]NSY57968.1 polysaccharide deacetylase family protein [Agrobacterium tumefaciens]NTZ59443.1 polysaccharide deacetylase family protein [Agrobacterium tumefaciens]OMP73045.1 polysaccharide deacetylase [Agrobacterium tumefaciens]